MLCHKKKHAQHLRIDTYFISHTPIPTGEILISKMHFNELRCKGESMSGLQAHVLGARLKFQLYNTPIKKPDQVFMFEPLVNSRVVSWQTTKKLI